MNVWLEYAVLINFTSNLVYIRLHYFSGLHMKVTETPQKSHYISWPCPYESNMSDVSLEHQDIENLHDFDFFFFYFLAN